MPNPTQTSTESLRRQLIRLLCFAEFLDIQRFISIVDYSRDRGVYHTVGESCLPPWLGSGTPIRLAYLEIFPSGWPLRNAGKPFSVQKVGFASLAFVFP